LSPKINYSFEYGVDRICQEKHYVTDAGPTVTVTHPDARHIPEKIYNFTQRSSP